ncbi:unnamed protein product [Clonostachys byssicola]|uniref:Uncharacterized protein n=1 Tax=Clonostachys byssicola TaxID=160290 RepID=A0A9N9Y8B2_9HYPO|nr:unnamed protein product [Clonostachys byssicola]
MPSKAKASGDAAAAEAQLPPVVRLPGTTAAAGRAAEPAISSEISAESASRWDQIDAGGLGDAQYISPPALRIYTLKLVDISHPSHALMLQLPQRVTQPRAALAHPQQFGALRSIGFWTAQKNRKEAG